MQVEFLATPFWEQAEFKKRANVRLWIEKMDINW